MVPSPSQPPRPVRLRLLVEEDLPTLHRWYQSPELSAHLVGDVASRSESEAVTFMRRWTRHRAEAERYAIERLDDGRLVGQAALLEIASGAASLHLFLGEPDVRGQGLGRATVEALLDRAFAGLGLHSVRLEVLEANVAARALYAAAGFTEQGRRAEPVLKAGRPVPVFRMNLSATVWLHR